MTIDKKNDNVAEILFEDMNQVISQLVLAKKSAQELRKASGEKKNLFLKKLADLLLENVKEILSANAKDVNGAADIAPALKKRLSLSEESIKAMALGVKEMINLPDPVGEVTEKWQQPNGMKVEKVRVPIGVIFFVFEARPNVIIDAAALAIKSGNVLVARGGKEARHSNEILEKLIQRALQESGLPQGAVQQLADKNREAIYEVLKYSEYVDLAVARGREQLISAVKKHSRVPVIAHERGLCSIYIDEFADKVKAIKIVVNAKISNPAVCNSVETVLIHRAAVKNILPDLIDHLIKEGVEVRGSEEVCAVDSRCQKASDADWDTEYLALIISIKIVASLDEALAHIEKHGSRHSDAIITENVSNANKFIREVNNAAALVNASTRLVDGGQFGLGAEFGVSTASIHMRGPMGLKDLTVTKYVVLGDGQIRE